MDVFPIMGRLNFRTSHASNPTHNYKMCLLKHIGTWQFQVQAKKFNTGWLACHSTADELLTIKICTFQIFGQMDILFMFIFYVWHPSNIVNKKHHSMQTSSVRRKIAKPCCLVGTTWWLAKVCEDILTYAHNLYYLWESAVQVIVVVLLLFSKRFFLWKKNKGMCIIISFFIFIHYLIWLAVKIQSEKTNVLLTKSG